MKKSTLMTVLLLILPLLMVVIAAGPSGVTVFDGENTAYYSWLQPVVKSSFGWCAPVAALLNYLLFGIGVFYAVTKKQWCLKGIFGISFVAACIAVLPVVIQSEIKVVPNVMGAILLGADCVVAYLARKQAETEKEGKSKGKRLERR